MSLNERSEKRLVGVHPDLIRVIRRAAEATAFVVTEGVRSLSRQEELYKAGASRTMNSRHLTGHAVDLAVLVGNEVSWSWPLYKTLAGVVLAAAAAENVAIVWGGSWTKFKDGPHFELDRKVYP
jgi:peptidoglycan L-alanyl-D-glutamate endopeptidase CwlK